jgi:hypothetical protein
MTDTTLYVVQWSSCKKVYILTVELMLKTVTDIDRPDLPAVLSLYILYSGAAVNKCTY